VVAVSGDVVRSGEWRQVRDFAVMVRGRPAAMAIAGEAGSGKSTLWRGGVEAAAESGHRVLRSEPSAAEADLAFSVLSDLLTDVLAVFGAEIPDPQREALEVALLLRAAGEHPPTVRAVGLAVLAALRGLASDGPLLLAVDDVQWMDGASQDALTFALRRLETGPIGLLVAARTEAHADPLTASEPPLPHGWRDLLAATPSETLDLEPLDDWQVQGLLPSSVSAAQARMIARESRGNPFWAREIAASLASSDTPVPALARTLTRRLARSLSQDASEALAVVACAGRIDIATAAAVLSHLDRPSAALDEAVLAGVIVESGYRVAPAHPLIGAAAVEALPPGQRQEIYGRLAAASDGPERYGHFAALAVAPGPDASVADKLDAAAEASIARAGNTEAAQFAAQAVQFTPGEDRTSLTRRRIRAGELYFLAGEPKRTVELLEVLDLGELRTEDLERALPLLLDMVDIVRGNEAARSILTRLTEATGADARRDALILTLASDLIYGARGGRVEAARAAIRRAEEAGPAASVSLHRALINLADAKMVAGDGLDHEVLNRAEQLESQAPTARIYDSADLSRGLWSPYAEDIDTARAALGRCIARARDAGDEYAQFTFQEYLAVAEQFAGDFHAARIALEAADAAAAWHDWPLAPWDVHLRCELLIAEGDLDSALAFADQHLDGEAGQPPTARLVRALARGRVCIWRGGMAEAIGHFEEAGRCAAEAGFADPAVRQWLDSSLAEAYIAEGRTEEAQPIYEWLRATGERLGRHGPVGHADRLQALAAAQAGDLETAARYAHSAVAAFEASPLRMGLARSLVVLGHIERRRRSRKQSRAALGRALDLAGEMGHRPLRAAVERELPRIAATRSGDELTVTEQRVADLIAGGATNREAALELFVSVRTIETHVAAIYRKLGIRTRAELARRLTGRSAK
jgi:DNA-binding CsgD family transcriptional regulator